MSDRQTTGDRPDERPLTGAFRADGRPPSIDDYEAAGGYEALRAALANLRPPSSCRW